MISCGSKYNHPDEEVLSGIILSVFREAQEGRKILPVTVLVTTKQSLKKMVLHLPPDVDSNCAELVHVKYIRHGAISSVPIDLLSDDDLAPSTNKYLVSWTWRNAARQVESTYYSEIARGGQETFKLSGNVGIEKEEDEDPSLSEYLKVIDASLNQEDMSLSSVLQILVRPQVERKLSQFSSKHGTSALVQNIIKMIVREESEFILSGKTHRQSAKSAKLMLQLPESSFFFMDLEVQAITVDIQNAKSLDMVLKVDVEFPIEEKVRRTMSLDFSALCMDCSSVGHPLLTLLDDIHSLSKPCEYTVGSLLGLLLGAPKAEDLLCSFPIILSAYIALWKL